MNDLSDTAVGRPQESSVDVHICHPVPKTVVYVLVPLFAFSLALSLFILVAVRNAVFFVAFLLLSSLVLAFLVWNARNFRSNRGVLFFLSTVPDSDLRTAKDGQLVKITGFASCGSLSVESSYEKVSRCIYTSTKLYEYRGIISKLAKISSRTFGWTLAFQESFATDFFILDKKSGITAAVKAGQSTKIIPLITETTLVHTTRRTAAVSPYLKNWLGERNLHLENGLIRLEEGYIKEGCSLTVMGVLTRNNGVAVIVQPPEPFSMGCLWRKFLLPFDIDALILRVTDRGGPEIVPCSSLGQDAANERPRN
ncbi:hypothetical protein H6P81_005496 [Aristolochia fimbriata]|uniref:Uncharacterized protein n=1 Tax=Aristolochia fimbriata TaxID=158543 RepID=A0AAV7EY59_ARIFI|nr:hypothetical protein H6P81_005496 [Aristolochia fimbriata]